MPKDVVEITGFRELQAKIKRLPDKVKRREVVKILGQAANPTVKAVRSLTPVGDGKINKANGKSYTRKKRQVRKVVYQEQYIAGIGKKSIGKKSMRRSKNPMVYVSPRSRKGKDGFYLRRFVSKGTKYQKDNDFVDKAYNQTKGKVSADAEVKMAKYIQKQITRLSS